MKRLMVASVAVAAMLLLSARNTEAGGHRVTFASTGHHHHHGHGIRDDHGDHGGFGLRRPYLRQVQLRHIGPGYSPISRAPRWHDTTHLDYHPGEWRWCNGHLIYIPGHYDVHRTGHWDY